MKQQDMACRAHERNDNLTCSDASCSERSDRPKMLPAVLLNAKPMRMMRLSTLSSNNPNHKARMYKQE
eukprot:1158408-Pelagomonas_calceolata.AAC.10